MALLTPAALARLRAWRARLAATVAAAACLAAAPAPEEYQVKAVFLFNFTQFVEWPPEAFTDPTAPFVIGILGRDPFGSALDDAVRGEKVNGRPLVVRRYSRLSELKPCQILFIDRSARGEAQKALAAVDRQRTLTVSDFAPGAERDVVIRFLTEDNKIRLRINVDSAREAGLTISSKLLRPSQVVGTSAPSAP